jgi:hypothetical protein
MFVTRNTTSLLSPGAIVINNSANPEQVDIFVSGKPTGIVLDGSEVYDMEEPTRIIGHVARIVFGPGTSIQLPAGRVPPGYDGRIARYVVGDNGSLTVATSADEHTEGTIVGLNPTWVTWG